MRIVTQIVVKLLKPLRNNDFHFLTKLQIRCIDEHEP